jgi:hypothetical protein
MGVRVRQDVVKIKNDDVLPGVLRFFQPIVHQPIIESAPVRGIIRAS